MRRRGDACVAHGGVPLSATYNLRNELTARDSGGAVRFRGGIGETGTVTINGQPAGMHEGNVFEAEVPLSDGTSTVHLQARDASGNVATKDYQVTVAPTHEGYSYDDNGNLATKTLGADTWVYTWNAENQLVRVDKNGVEIASFRYDPLGRRIRKVAGGVTYKYAYDGQDIVKETRSVEGQADQVYTYIHGPGIDEPLARVDGAGVAYFHADGLGSIVKMTDASAATLLDRVYDAWGNPELGAEEPGYAFTGREWDPETGLYYYRARYYDPKVGRFISEDPIGLEGGINRYDYVGGRPIFAVDPLGLTPGNPTPVPGTLRATPDEAALDAYRHLIKYKMEFGRVEFGGTICKRTCGRSSRYLATGPTTDLKEGVVDTSKAPCAVGDIEVGYWHTHPAGELRNVFSDKDLRIVYDHAKRDEDYQGYLMDGSTLVVQRYKWVYPGKPKPIADLSK